MFMVQLMMLLSMTSCSYLGTDLLVEAVRKVFY